MKTNLLHSSLAVLITLLGALNLAAQQPPTNSPGKFSITVSNRSDVSLSLTLTAPAPAPGQRSHPPGLGVITKRISANQSDHLELEPGEYRFETSSTNGHMLLLFGYMPVTNSEVWIFTAEPSTNRWALRNWYLEIPTRPGFQLAKYHTPVYILPQRTKREDYHPATLQDLPQRVLRLPPGMSNPPMPNTIHSNSLSLSPESGH